MGENADKFFTKPVKVKDDFGIMIPFKGDKSFGEYEQENVEEINLIGELIINKVDFK